jgi:hypothetical protein
MSPKEKLGKVLDILNEADGRLAHAQLLEHEVSIDARALIRVRAILGEHIQLIRLSIAA